MRELLAKHDQASILTHEDFREIMEQCRAICASTGGLGLSHLYQILGKSTLVKSIQEYLEESK